MASPFAKIQREHWTNIVAKAMNVFANARDNRRELNFKIATIAMAMAMNVCENAKENRRKMNFRMIYCFFSLTYAHSARPNVKKIIKNGKQEL